jgi:hypothetical protein
MVVVSSLLRVSRAEVLSELKFGEFKFTETVSSGGAAHVKELMRAAGAGQVLV